MLRNVSSVLLNQVENGGRCGVCGDPWDARRPRPGEAGGLLGRGVTTRVYRPGQTVSLSVDITANHRGYFQFRVCPRSPASQALHAWH